MRKREKAKGKGYPWCNMVVSVTVLSFIYFFLSMRHTSSIHSPFRLRAGMCLCFFPLDEILEALCTARKVHSKHCILHVVRSYVAPKSSRGEEHNTCLFIFITDRSMAGNLLLLPRMIQPHYKRKEETGKGRKKEKKK